jgi:hypothetical protein
MGAMNDATDILWCFAMGSLAADRELSARAFLALSRAAASLARAARAAAALRLPR